MAQTDTTTAATHSDHTYAIAERIRGIASDSLYTFTPGLQQLSIDTFPNTFICSPDSPPTTGASAPRSGPATSRESCRPAPKPPPARSTKSARSLRGSDISAPGTCSGQPPSRLCP